MFKGLKGITVLVAAAVVVNELSGSGHRYLNAGGLGILIGDGRLPHPGPEAILEVYYSLSIAKGVTLTAESPPPRPQAAPSVASRASPETARTAVVRRERLGVDMISGMDRVPLVRLVRQAMDGAGCDGFSRR